jgi:hypothetical protein
MSGFIGLAARALLLPGVLDLTSSAKKKKPKLKFPKIYEGKPLERLVPKVYTKGSGTRKVND